MLLKLKICHVKQTRTHAEILHDVDLNKSSLKENDGGFKKI